MNKPNIKLSRRNREDCIFTRPTLNPAADLENRITPCQFGGTSDCSQYGCIASAGLAAIGDYRLDEFLTVRSLYNLSGRPEKQSEDL
ncbi:MAG TPA: hypothetical protein VGB02_21870 [Pyrinomonadaceae bacterium]|jgi:hypothetical protein